VITNDLAYIATMIDPAEVERSRARCNAISGGLAHLGALGSCCDTKEALALDQLLSIFNVSAPLDAAAARISVVVSEGLVELAARLLRELIGAADGSFVDLGGANRMAIVLQARAASEFSECYGSLGAFAAAQRGERFIVEAGIIDLILRDHGWMVAVACEDRRMVVRLEFAPM
jgi:hypothetical protein